MNIVSPPNLKLIEFSIGPYQPTRNLIIYPFSGKVESITHSPPSWAGTVGWGTSDPNNKRHIEKRKLLTRFHHLLQGLGVVRIDLTSDYLPANETPIGLTAEVSSSVINANGLQVTLDYSNQGAFVNDAGDYLNMGERLYLITEANGNIVTVLPEVPPINNSEVEISKPFIKAALDASSPISRRGAALITHSFPWYEDIA